MNCVPNHDAMQLDSLYVRFQHPIASIGGDDNYTVIYFANAEMKIGHERMNYVGGNSLQ